jgi:UDP-2,4-diacetamido-2,4,6-trideoxy-beta-L-altropyranose hydrolase
LKQKNVFIRADGGDKIGLGHLVRCLALAEMIKFDYIISFVCKQIPNKSAEEIKQLGINLLIIDCEESFLSLLSGNEIVVLDHYGLDKNYQFIIKKKGCKLICIDDLHKEHFFADAIINHAPGAKKEQYDAESYTQFYLGLNYALLRSEFRNQVSWNRRIESIDETLICFGGSDPLNITCKILSIITQARFFKNINVIVGNSFQFISELSQFISNHNYIRLFSNLNSSQMIGVMHNCELAIVPSSSIAIECFVAKQILLTGVTDSNQKDIHDGLVQYNTVRTIGDFRKLNPNKIFEELKIINDQKNEFIFPNIGNTEISIKNIFKSLNHDNN